MVRQSVENSVGLLDEHKTQSPQEVVKIDIQIINILHVAFLLGQVNHTMDNLCIFVDVLCVALQLVQKGEFPTMST